LVRSSWRWRSSLRCLVKLLLKPADIPESIEDLLDVLTLAKEKNIKQWKQIKPIMLDQYYYEMQ
jgi:hypothetical protein